MRELVAKFILFLDAAPHAAGPTPRYGTLSAWRTTGSTGPAPDSVFNAPATVRSFLSCALR
jgi:hypothetical protein